jgi:hypothetical protein
MGNELPQTQASTISFLHADKIGSKVRFPGQVLLKSSSLFGSPVSQKVSMTHGLSMISTQPCYDPRTERDFGNLLFAGLLLLYQSSATLPSLRTALNNIVMSACLNKVGRMTHSLCVC